MMHISEIELTSTTKEILQVVTNEKHFISIEGLIEKDGVIERVVKYEVQNNEKFCTSANILIGKDFDKHQMMVGIMYKAANCFNSLQDIAREGQGFEDYLKSKGFEISATRYF